MKNRPLSVSHRSATQATLSTCWDEWRTGWPQRRVGQIVLCSGPLARPSQCCRLGPADATLTPLACAASGNARCSVVALGPADATLTPLACAASGNARWHQLCHDQAPLCARHRSLVGHSPQDEKQQDRRGGVQQHIGQMMPARAPTGMVLPTGAEQLAIEHVASMASGYHSPCGPSVSAQWMFAAERPSRTCELL